MKNINYIINGVLAVCIVILFILHFTGKKESSVAPAFVAGADSAKMLPVAYVDIDSLLLNYNFSKDLNERIVTTQESYRQMSIKKQVLCVLNFKISKRKSITMLF